MASMTKREVIKKEVEFNIESKEIIEKEIKHLKDVSKKAYGMSKIQYEQIIIKKEEELLNCIEWLNSTEAIKLKIQSLEKTIEFRKLIIQQNHPMTTIQDIKEMNIDLHKYEDELQIYIDKLKQFDNISDLTKKDTETINEALINEPKILKIKKIKPPNKSKVNKRHQHPLECKPRAPNYFCTCDVCGDQIISSLFNCKKCDYDECENCVVVSGNSSEINIPKETTIKETNLPKVKEPKLPKEVKVKEDKPKKKAIPSTIKKLVWNTNIGEDIGKAKCVCCKSTDITQISFNCGHVISEHNGGETKVSNLKPICQNCNSSMGTKNMNDFMLTLL